jgi:hypothetical protein
MTGSGSVTTSVTVPPVTGADFDIVDFDATREVGISEERDHRHSDLWDQGEDERNVVEFRLSVVNDSTVTGSAPATLIGLQNGVQVYSRTITVSAPAGRHATYTFPSYRPTKEGTIYWTVTITDTTPDTATAKTRVEEERNHKDKHEDNQHR